MANKVLFTIACFFVAAATVMAQGETDNTPTTPAAGSRLTDNTFLQAGLDMTLQNPYGKSFRDVLPNGKTFGVDVALGKTFTPLLALRGKVNWENGLPLLENHHATWLGPFGERDTNHDKGGYLSLVGDVMLSVKPLFDGQAFGDRWQPYIYPRAGVVYNFGVSKGSPLLGAGIGTRYRLTPALQLYADAAYQMVSSGFSGSQNTGIGSNSNGFFDVNVGVQFDLGKGRGAGAQSDAAANGDVRQRFPGAYSLSEGWFVQAAVDMSLMNPYGKSFRQTFPKGKTYGVNVALGKWFDAAIALRARVNWENGLIENKHLEWLASIGPDGRSTNHDDGGFLSLVGDVMINVQGLLGKEPAQHAWNLIVYPRAGLIRNESINSMSPLVGAGMENAFRLNDRMSLTFDLDYQMSTSEFNDNVSVTGMKAGTGTNGFFDLSLGLRYDL